MKKEYLGDAVYVQVKHDSIVLTAENGIAATDTIYLEPNVLKALAEYLQRNFPELAQLFNSSK
jgi:hypothetical protein